MEKRKVEWLAGLIDGDGCFLISKAGDASMEITMGIGDERALKEIKQYVGGAVKARAGMKAFRYRLHNDEGMRVLIGIVNGEIRNPIRQAQLKAVCEQKGIQYKAPAPLVYKSG